MSRQTKVSPARAVQWMRPHGLQDVRRTPDADRRREGEPRVLRNLRSEVVGKARDLAQKGINRLVGWPRV